MRRARSRIIDVLNTNMATELTNDAPAGLNVTAPATVAYYAMRNAKEVKEHAERNHHVQVYVYPSSKREDTPRTSGALVKSYLGVTEFTIAVRVAEEVGAATYSADWKDLTAKEREEERLDVILGAISDVMHSKARGPTPAQDAAAVGDDIVNVEHDGDDGASETFGNNGTWGVSIWRVYQVVNIPVQNS